MKSKKPKLAQKNHSVSIVELLRNIGNNWFTLKKEKMLATNQEFQQKRKENLKK